MRGAVRLFIQRVISSEVDWLAVIADWVEQGKAPERLVAAKHAQGQLVLSRPLYPYPETTIYKGSGEPNKAESFGRVR